jgi:hypothetical protein
MTGPNHDPTVLVEKEKTKRVLIFMSAVVIMGVTALVLFTSIIGDRKGNVTIDPKGGKIEINVEERTIAPFGDSVTVTTRSITDSAAQELARDTVATRSGATIRGNFIDRNIGVVLPGATTSKWKPTGASTDSLVTLATSTSRVQVTKRAVEPTRTIQQLARAELTAIKRRDRTISVMTDIDSTERTAVLWYEDPATKQAVCIKLMLYNGIVYRAEGAAPAANAAARKEVIELVTRFAPIEPAR